MSLVNICYVTFLVGAGVCFFAPFVSAIKCYQCSSHEHPECADIPANDTTSPFLHKCAPRDGYEMFCRKIVQTIIDTTKETRVTRSCGWLLYKSNTSLCQNTDTDFKFETTCQCFSDACNSGRTLISGFGVMMVVIGGLLLG